MCIKELRLQFETLLNLINFLNTFHDELIRKLTTGVIAWDSSKCQYLIFTLVKC